MTYSGNKLTGKAKIISDYLPSRKSLPGRGELTRITAIAEISLASKGKEKIPLFAWGKTAEYLMEKTKKGDTIYISDGALSKYNNQFNIQIKEAEIIKD